MKNTQDFRHVIRKIISNFATVFAVKNATK